MEVKLNKKISTENVITLLKILVCGFLLAESFYLSQVILIQLDKHLISNGTQWTTLAFCLTYLLVVAIYLFYRDAHLDFLKIIKSKRVDIAIAFCVGILSDIYLGGLGTNIYQQVVSKLSVSQLRIIVVLPFFIILSFLIRALYIWFTTRKRKDESFFINDNEQYSRKDDLLGFSETANRFAERVLNQESLDSLVFGVDAPWGVGKSTFINFCKEYWEEKHKGKVIVYVFEPLRYENREKLLEKFIDGLIGTIQKNIFIPEIKPIISRYAQHISGIKGSILGFLNLEILSGTYSVDDAFSDLEGILSSVDKKIIVVIDDLDRLTLTGIKDLLFTIKKSFTLPNITFVLCYDAENISALEEHSPDIDKITEFLEKFVNVKIGLYLSSEDLSQYTSKNFEKSLSGNSQADPSLVAKAISGLKDIFNSTEYYRYVPFVGDIRKLKRLINITLLLDIEKTDFDNSDINSQDLVHLLLIYINYPNIFRKIYNTETGGKKGFFSVLSFYEDGYPKDQNKQQNQRDSEYKNSILYTEYTKSLNDNQKFLLNTIFDVSRRLGGKHTDSISLDIKHSYACFNGDIWSTGGRNLEAYLNLIVRSSKPQTTDQYKFYLNCKDIFVKEESINKILSKDEFSYSNGEANRKQLWKVLVNSATEFSSKASDSLITYLLDHMCDYSHFTSEELGLGMRHDLSLYLVQLLDQAGWIDEEGKHQNNTDKNVSQISEWIFGEGKHAKNGIISTFSLENKGILGLYDLLTFRLFCNADRGGSFYNLQNALSKHTNPNAPTAGLVKTIAIEEMREISQRVFQVFKTQYIDKKYDIFELVEKLTLDELSGKYKGFIEAKIKSKELMEAENIISKAKWQILIFIIYQLASTSIEFGIACGYYDVTGTEDKNGIHKAVNDYLFEVCFNPGKKKNNRKSYQQFLDYLLMTFASVFKGIQGHGFVPKVDKFSKALDKESLYSFWKKNCAKIKSLNFVDQDRTIITSNYTASYKTDLPEVYKVLDEFIKEVDTKDNNKAVAITAVKQ